jgi:osmotically-inducible protein OsmY
MTDAQSRLKDMKKLLWLALGAAVLATGLSGCFPVIVGAVAYSSYAATDRRTLGAQTDDKVIAVRGETEEDDQFGRAAHINVTSFNRKVLLTGQVLDAQSKARAEQIVRAYPEVLGVVNELMISYPSSIGQRSTDTYITTQIKSAMVNRSDLFANAYKVVTENGTVYLMGRVTQREGEYAAEIARQTPYVNGVVKVFDYISEDELKRMQQQTVPPPDAVPPPAPPPPPPGSQAPNTPPAQ